MLMLPENDKKRLIARLRRAEGQLKAVERMVDDGTACVDTLIQIAAIQGALSKIGGLILSEHIESCVSEAFINGDSEQRQEAIDDLMDVFNRYGNFGGRK